MNREELEQENKHLKQIIELQKQLLEEKSKQQIVIQPYVIPTYPQYPWYPVYPQPFTPWCGDTIIISGTNNNVDTLLSDKCIGASSGTFSLNSGQASFTHSVS